jgi:FkbM family methyltransferase
MSIETNRSYSATSEIRESFINQFMSRAKGILHLGAHKGQERTTYYKLGKPVVWIEALPQIHAHLKKNIQSYSNQQALCAVLGNKNGVQTKFHISNNANGVSSSIFPFGEHGNGDKSLWPSLRLKMVDSITLPMIRLDTLLSANNILAENYDFWVVDLQGAELLALQGAGNLMQTCTALYTEVSTVDVYQGGVLWPELGHWLDQTGFTPLWWPDKQHDMVLFVHKAGEDIISNK